MKTPITWQSIRQHMTYSWWKYVLMAILVIFGWNLTYTVTAYHPPKEKCVKLYMFGVGETDLMNAYMEQVRVNEMSDMEEMSCAIMMVDDTYTPMQLMTYIAAGEGHLYMLPKDYFNNYATESAFLPLENVPGLTDWLDANNISYDRGWRVDQETGEEHLFGIPMAAFKSFDAYALGYDEHFLSISVTNGNDDNSYKFLRIFLEDMLDPAHQPPEIAR